MYSGEGVRVRFLAYRSMITELVDWFGLDFDVNEKDADMVEIDVIVNEDASEGSVKCLFGVLLIRFLERREGAHASCSSTTKIF